MYRSKPQAWTSALVFAISVAGGVFLNYYFKQSSFKQPSRSKAMPHQAAKVPLRLPSARLGAREDQVDRTMQQPSQRAFEEGEASPTGAAYDLDPRSISPG